MKYDASSVKVLEGLEGIRTRPDMYVTDTSYEGLHQCFIEGFVNAVDEAQVGFGKIINITMLNPIGFIVEDFGRGMPVENFEDTGIPTAEILFTKMHSGGKMDDGAYKTSVGQMGLGCKILNTLGELTDVSINRDGYNWTMAYSRMETIKRLTRGAKVSKTGTTVKWIPDNQIFDTLKFSPSKIKTIVKDMAYLTPGVTYNILEEATGKKDVFMFKRGLFDLYDDVVTKGTILRKPIVIEYDKEINLQILLNYSDEMEFVRNYANCLKMQEDGGTHMSGFRAGLTKAINQFAKDNNLLKDKDGTIEGSELRSGMIMIMKLNMSGVKFANQTKTKVNNPFLTPTVSSIVYNSLMEYFKIYPEHAKLIINKALLNRKVRLAVQKAKEVALGTKETKKLTNIVDGSFKACLSKKPHECEVYICEGKFYYKSAILPSLNPFNCLEANR